uniref:Uncharacterized protein n=1 Tax=Felis catus TaxID=9685 RepID=A0ABI7ZCY0_FELCA
MDAVSQVPMEAVLPKHILAIWVIVLIILAIMVIMTSLFAVPGHCDHYLSYANLFCPQWD